MYRLTFILPVLAVCHECHAQLTGVAFDMETRRPVAGAAVYINPKGSVLTDKHGRFTINGKCHSVTFSHISYESRSMNRSELRDTVWLMPKANRLDEVVVTAIGPKVRLDIKELQKDASLYRKPSSGVDFDFFSIFDRSSRRRSEKDRKRLENILKNY